MFAVGHLSAGYLFSKASAKLLKQELNLPLIFMLSIIPDIDLLLPGIEHRSVTHSIIVAVIAFLPFFAIYKAKAVPYFLALAQHSLVGDIITGGNGEGPLLLWPVTSTPYGFPIPVFSYINIILEWITFTLAFTLMYRSRDLHNLLRGKFSQLYLSIPALTILFPSFLDFPIPVPYSLMIPHLVYLGLITVSILALLLRLS